MINIKTTRNRPPLPPDAHPLDPAGSYRLAWQLGRPLALGYLSKADVYAALVLDVCRRLPAHQYVDAVCRRMMSAATEAEVDLVRRRGRAERDIQAAIWDLCAERRPGRQILAAADRVDQSVLRPDEVLELCRSIAARASRTRRAAR